MSCTAASLRRHVVSTRLFIPIFFTLYFTLVFAFVKLNMVQTSEAFEQGQIEEYKRQQTIIAAQTKIEEQREQEKDPKLDPRNEDAHHGNDHTNNFPKTVVFFIILCEGKDNRGVKGAADIERQIRQAAVTLKSAAALTKVGLHYIVVADSEELFERFKNLCSNWPEEYRSRVSFEYRAVWYPPNREDMRSLFRVCATERLFLPDMFPDLDAAIYIDTDLIFFRPPEDLWNIFNDFNKKQVAAMSPCLYHYGTKRNKIPFYGKSGLNAGIMHMNLTRMKKFPEGGWTPANMATFDKHRNNIKLADQDILNILFNKYPKLLYELGCDWNFRVWQCKPEPSRCKDAAVKGVSILHGNAMSFVGNHEMKIQTVFEEWEKYELGTPLSSLLATLEIKLEQVSKRRLPSNCASLPNFDKFLLQEFRKHV